MIDTALYRESVHFQFAVNLFEIMKVFFGYSMFENETHQPIFGLGNINVLRKHVSGFF